MTDGQYMSIYSFKENKELLYYHHRRKHQLNICFKNYKFRLKILEPNKQEILFHIRHFSSPITHKHMLPNLYAVYICFLRTRPLNLYCYRYILTLSIHHQKKICITFSHFHQKSLKWRFKIYSNDLAAQPPIEYLLGESLINLNQE